MKILISSLAVASILAGCADYHITSRAKGGSVISNGANYDLGLGRYGSPELTYAEISEACNNAAWQNGAVAALFFAPVPVGGGLSTAATVALGSLSVIGTASLVRNSGYAKCMGINYGIAVAPVDGGAIGLPVNPEEAKVWNGLTEAQRIRAAKFVEAGGTVRSALLPD